MVQQIEIKGTPINIIFGMHFAESFLTYSVENVNTERAVDSIEMLINLIWFGYLNDCEIEKTAPEIERKDVHRYVEMAYSESDEKKLAIFIEIFAMYRKSVLGKSIEENAKDDDKKKELIGQRLESLPLE